MINSIKPFQLGKVVLTPGAIAALEAAGEDAAKFLGRHARGDWGDVSAEDWKSNDDSLRTDCRLVSSFRLKDGTVLWVITEADRSGTTILLPDEY